MTQSDLNTVDWSFERAKTQGGAHGIHPYPAKFIPQIPRQLIDLLGLPSGTCVFDPFCGSGTTLAEAMASGIPSVGVDLSPIACLIARVKTTPLAADSIGIVSEVSDEAAMRLAAHDFRIPEIPRLDHWFQPQVQASLAAIRTAINGVTDSEMRDALRVAMSSIIVRVSNQDSDTRYAAVVKDVSAESVIAIFRRRARDLVGALTRKDSLFEDLGPRPQIINKNVLTVEAHEIPMQVGLVITSPPYPNAYEYWLYHKYRMYWLDMDPIDVRKHEIGARPHYFKSKDPHTAEHFREQMAGVFSLLVQVVVEDGAACFLIGRSIIRGENVDNLALLTEAAARHGFGLADVVERNIPRTRKAFNLSHANIKTEHVAVFRRNA
ncbi:MAG: RNA methyltransferase [Phycisphaeraceae bacterium]|nr:RNA methyltransferase [Phycisphaeraceae bacterium]MCB9848760.1 RNA methyltransferase [Phycisphaeraceae bacterium]